MKWTAMDGVQALLGPVLENFSEKLVYLPFLLHPNRKKLIIFQIITF